MQKAAIYVRDPLPAPGNTIPETILMTWSTDSPNRLDKQLH